MNSKRSSGLGGGDSQAGAREEDSIEDSLNQILAEVEAGPDAEKATKGSRVVETPPEGAVDDAAGSAALEATPIHDQPTPVRTPDEVNSMSGPALVDDAKEEVTDVESPEALAALAASAEGPATPAEGASAAPDSLADAAGTPVRDPLTAGLLKAAIPQEEIVTATGGGSQSNNDVITAENVDFFHPPSDARRKDDSEPSASGEEASTANLGLTAEARDERDRAMRRSRPPMSTTPLPRRGGGAHDASADEPEAELELSDLDYDRERSPASLANDNDGAGSRRPGAEAAWPSAAPASDSGPVRRTPPPFSASITGTGRHTLPPPVTPGPGSPARGRLPTPRAVSPLGTPGSRNSSPAIPIQAPIGSSGPMLTTRSTSAVFNKVQLPLGGLVTVVGAAFGVGLIIGAVLWRGGAADADSSTARAGGEARPAPAPPEPAPGANALAPAPAPVTAAPAPVAPPPPAPAAIEPPAPVAQPAVPPTGAASAAASGAAAAGSDTSAATGKKVAAASTKLPRPKRPVAAPGATAGAATGRDAPAGKPKSATWVDPFAQ